MQSVTTIGNATLIAYDNNLPVLTTDPWFGDEDDAYFGSWTLSHEIPIEFKLDTMYDYFKKQGGGLLPRNHPTKESHQLWSDRLYNMFINKKEEDEF